MDTEITNKIGVIMDITIAIGLVSTVLILILTFYFYKDDGF
jgi:hypothetical protein